jgi:hypothetical protein
MSDILSRLANDQAFVTALASKAALSRAIVRDTQGLTTYHSPEQLERMQVPCEDLSANAFTRTRKTRHWMTGRRTTRAYMMTARPTVSRAYVQRSPGTVH